MIGKLTGLVDSIADDTVILDVGGVGYLVQCPATTLSRLAVGAPASLMTEMKVSDDAIRLAVEQTGKDERSALRQLRRKARRQFDQRPGENIGDQQIVWREAGDERMIDPRCRDEQDAPRVRADDHVVHPGVFFRHLDRDRVDVRREAMGARPER